jgi:response regulator of citrate/malate metabolism
LKKGSLVFVANTISEGLHFLQEESPDFTFLDNNLPDGFGWSKTDFISANYPETNLILITAMDIADSSSKSFRILHKPLLKDELRRMFP